MIRRWIAPLAVALAASGCARGIYLKPDVWGTRALLATPSPREADSSAAALPHIGPGDPRPPYRIGPLDRITVVVTGRPDLGSQLPLAGGDQVRISTVGQDGAINLPLLGAVPAAGKSAAELRTDVQSRYAKIISAPQVDVEVITCRSQAIEVGGEVGRPGAAYLSDGLRTLDEALTEAGGLGPSADPERAILVRKGKRYRLEYRPSQPGLVSAGGVLLEAGDRLYVPSIHEREVKVFGEVTQQGTYPIPTRGLTLLGALAQAQGTTQYATVKSVYLVRPKASGDSIVYSLRMTDLMEGPEVPLAPGDRLYVPPSWLASLGRGMYQILPLVTVIGTVVLVGYDVYERRR